MVSVALNDFVKRQTVESEFSCHNRAVGRVLNFVQANWDKREPGYRDGVVSVPLIGEDAAQFLTGVVELFDNDSLSMEWKPRREKEPARLQVPRVAANGCKKTATHVDIICYSHETLGDDASTTAEWEVVSINARLQEMPEPMHFLTLMYNHYGYEGGTETAMTDAQFVIALRDSFSYWQGKALAK